MLEPGAKMINGGDTMAIPIPFVVVSVKEIRRDHRARALSNSQFSVLLDAPLGECISEAAR
jgi:hypothetical protein